ncbi:FAD-binding domain-containing protein [Sagittula sp. SSi028]|uniref:FAD-binding domain-containing protein n=1 Tax=Sagittula sp. SSi028 TaxID=3400636 RepID=UPI003AF7CCE3
MTGPDVIPTRSAALEALAKFAPRAGHLYALQRNYDLGADQHDNVSQLSPYIRHRLITEQEVLDAVLAHHSPQDAQKFIAEVFWRTYWKGWLEMRPDVWKQYQSDLTQAWNNVQTQSGLRSRWQDACMGQTGIVCFDHWARELAQTGYLHNHARMWFASIWIFTLKLPWVLGADFFLRHLLDGDCASNTLSWRWVAGLQTRGKHYLAEPENIARFTKGRFRPQAGDLDTDAQPLDGPMPPDPSAPPTAQDIDLTRPSALLLHMDDLAPDDLLDQGLRPMVTIMLPPSERMTPLRMSDKVQTFRSAALLDVTNRLADLLGDVVTCAPGQTLAAAKAAGAEQIVTHYAPTGPVADNLAQIDGLPLHQALRPFDARAWPYATKGFFKFKDKIPALLAAMRDKAPA